MNILIIGESKRVEELKSKLGGDHDLLAIEDLEGSSEATEGLDRFDVIFDLNFDDTGSNLKHYTFLDGKPVIVCAVKKQLAEIVSETSENIECVLIGMNLLPTFINRPKAEVSLLNQKDHPFMESTLAELGWDALQIEDRVGMVTPRIVFMIINEACFTVQEGTASLEDIDIGMKLGTNYPFGPFEWADKVGIKDVYETLTALYEDTHDERYKICSMLKTKYLKEEAFLS